MTDRQQYEAARNLLRARLADLDDGINSIDSQATNIKNLRESLERAEQALAEDKRSYREVEQALAILEAGAR